MGTISEVSGDPGAELPAAWVSACTGSEVVLPPLDNNYFEAVRESTTNFVHTSGRALVTVDSDSAK
ncbi:hypothetical protein LPJ81_006202, partial [Coemansia sp. IMI 209127]